jgi:hypothetical protein
LGAEPLRALKAAAAAAFAANRGNCRRANALFDLLDSAAADGADRAARDGDVAGDHTGAGGGLGDSPRL